MNDITSLDELEYRLHAERLPSRTVRRIVYLSSTETGAALFEWLSHQRNVAFVYVDTSNGKVTDWPEYDLGISFLYTHRIPSTQVGHHKWVNFHPAPLPELRGRNLAYHAILSGATHFGATLHYMDESFDTGDLIDVVRFPIQNWMNAGDLVERSHRHLRDLFIRWLPRLLENGEVPCVPQTKDGLYFPRTPIPDQVQITPDQERLIRALTTDTYSARFTIGGRPYILRPWSESDAQGA